MNEWTSEWTSDRIDGSQCVLPGIKTETPTTSKQQKQSYHRLYGKTWSNIAPRQVPTAPQFAGPQQDANLGWRSCRRTHAERQWEREGRGEGNERRKERHSLRESRPLRVPLAHLCPSPARALSSLYSDSPSWTGPCFAVLEFCWLSSQRCWNIPSSIVRSWWLYTCQRLQCRWLPATIAKNYTG